METFDINYLLKTKKRFDKVKDSLEQRMKDDFASRHDNCELTLADGNIEVPLGRALLNMFFWQFYTGLNYQISKKDAYTKSYISQSDINSYFNKIEKQVYETKICTLDEYRDRIATIMRDVASFSTFINVVAGCTIDYPDFLEAEQNHPDYKEMVEPKFPNRFEYPDMEKKFNQTGKSIEKFFTENKDTNMFPFVAAGSGISIKQAVQTLSFVGLKPNLANGQVLPYLITGNFMEGLNSISDYYINSMGTRAALSTNFTYTRRSGYLNRKLSLMMMDTWHDNNIKDCGTKYFIRYNVKDKNYLKLIDGRNYYDIIDGAADYDQLKTASVDDPSIIGKTIALRSPVCCITNAKENRVCATCYGRKMSEANKNLHTGITAVSEITNVLTQTLLSSKHLLVTDTDPVEWGAQFLKDFSVSMNEIYFNESSTKVEVIIPKLSDDDYDDEEGAYRITSFGIVDEDNKKPIQYTPSVPVYLVGDFAEKDTVTKLSSESVGPDKAIFKFVPHDNLLTVKLQRMIDLLENNAHDNETTYDGLVNKFAELLIENGMGHINLIHGEMLCSKLVVSERAENPLDWSAPTLKPYKIIRVSKADLNAPLSISMSFERINDQLGDLKTYEKDKSSIFDWLFR